MYYFPLTKNEDGILQIVLNPPVSVAGWTVRLTVTKRFEVPAMLQKWNVSGQPTSAASGVRVVDESHGVFQCEFRSADTSGWVPGNYIYSFERLSSGARTLLAQGTLVLKEANP